MQTHTSERLVGMAKLKNYISLGTDDITAELIQRGGGILCSEIHRLIISIWNEKELPEQWKES
jgi:hypothetical protein